jgi:DNA-binding response OmpR family regulator
MTQKILMVDDEADLLKISLLRFKIAGYEAFGAADGREGLDLARQKTPDLIVLDVFLPGMNGDEVARILKKDEKLKRIPIILISADVETLEKRARESGADDYLAKAFEAGELVGMIKSTLAKRGQKAALS